MAVTGLNYSRLMCTFKNKANIVLYSSMVGFTVVHCNVL